jgi:hypothetical protein
MLIPIGIRHAMIEVVLESHQIVRRRGIAIVAIEFSGLEVSRALLAQMLTPGGIRHGRVVVAERDPEALPVEAD